MLIPRHFAASVLAATLALGVTGCASDEPPSPGPGDDDAVGHVHGLGVDPADDTLYVATHFGLFHVDESGDASRVADRWQDTMAFTVLGPGHFLGSGHPDLREDLPAHLGLIESRDAGETWTALALQGEADFHILEPAGDLLYAYDATSGRLLKTSDRVTFDEILTAPLLSVAALPEDPDRLIATTGRGELVTIETTVGTIRELGGPPTVLLDTPPDGTLIGLDPAGVVRRSTDGGVTWRELGTLGGAPSAFTVTKGTWYAATEHEVFRSDDEGRTWTKVL